MSCICDCPKCGGINEFAICENAIIDAKVKVIKAERKVTVLWFIVGICVFITMSGALLSLI